MPDYLRVHPHLYLPLGQLLLGVGAESLAELRQDDRPVVHQHDAELRLGEVRIEPEDFPHEVVLGRHSLPPAKPPPATTNVRSGALTRQHSGSAGHAGYADPGCPHASERRSMESWCWFR